MLKQNLVKNSYGYLEGDEKALDSGVIRKAKEYKLQVIKSYLAINPQDIDAKFASDTYYVTRKYDGELNIIYFNQGEAVLINRNGNIKAELPCSEYAAQRLKEGGVKQALIPAELYFEEEGGRTRVFDTLKALADRELIGKLRLAPFEIIELDGEIFKALSYADTHKRLTELFPEEAALAAPVLCRKAGSPREIRELYKKFVEEEGGEGLVVRTPTARIFKIKPKYSLDAAVIGFSEGTGDAQGKIRSLLLALLTEDGKFHIVGRTGGGFSEEDKESFFQRFSSRIVPSKYIDTDSNHVAFRMIEPSMAAEIQLNDVIFETSTGPIVNNVIDFKGGGWELYSQAKGASLVSPIFVREREDKGVNPVDVRFAQLQEIQAMPFEERAAPLSETPRAKVLHREVYKKTQGEKLMVQKFVVWATGKEKLNPDYPAYVLSYTNYSSDRKERLQKDIRVSSDKEQIVKMLEEMVAENAGKKGWVSV